VIKATFCSAMLFSGLASSMTRVEPAPQSKFYGSIPG
jgi:hypothetical protein